MDSETIKTKGHTSPDGTLNVTVNVGLPDVDVAVTLLVTPLNDRKDKNGWPVDFFERVAGSMPDLERAPQGEFETRLSLE